MANPTPGAGQVLYDFTVHTGKSLASAGLKAAQYCVQCGLFLGYSVCHKSATLLVSGLCRGKDFLVTQIRKALSERTVEASNSTSPQTPGLRKPLPNGTIQQPTEEQLIDRLNNTPLVPGTTDYEYNEVINLVKTKPEVKQLADEIYSASCIKLLDYFKRKIKEQQWKEKLYKQEKEAFKELIKAKETQLSPPPPPRIPYSLKTHQIKTYQYLLTDIKHMSLQEVKDFRVHIESDLSSKRNYYPAITKEQKTSLLAKLMKKQYCLQIDQARTTNEINNLIKDAEQKITKMPKGTYGELSSLANLRKRELNNNFLKLPALRNKLNKV